MLAQLDALGARHVRAQAKLDDLTRQRDELVLAASAAGAPRRDVAQAARITAARVQQIIDAHR